MRRLASPECKGGAFRRSTMAATSIVGEVMLIGVVSIMAGSIGFIMLSSQEPPDDVPTLEFRAEVHCGGAAWAEGDETLRLTHIGGEDLDSDATRIVITVNGTSTSYGPGAYTGDLADGDFVIGEGWDHVAHMTSQDTIEYQVFTAEGGVDHAVIWREVDVRRCPGAVAS